MEDFTFRNIGLPVTKEQVQTLLHGLTALEGALLAIRQTVPNQIQELKGKLNSELQAIEFSGDPTLSTDQVARYLGCSAKRVHQLAGLGLIKIAHPGKKGRGNTTLFMTESVRALRVSRQKGTSELTRGQNGR